MATLEELLQGGNPNSPEYLDNIAANYYDKNPQLTESPVPEEAFNPVPNINMADDYTASAPLVPGAITNEQANGFAGGNSKSGQSPPSQASSSSRVSNGTSSSHSSSVSGLDPHTLANLTGDKTIDSRVARRMLGVNADASDTANDYNTALENQRKAVEGQAKVESDIANQNKQNLFDEAELTNHMAGVEQDEQAKAKGREDAAMGNYQTALKEYEAMEVNPGQLWNNLSGGGKFGSLMSVFVSGFLGSKGIETGVMSTLNKAVDRNIQAQLDNIDKKGKVTDKFKQLWDMTRAQSMSDSEARDKMRGFMLSDFKLAAAGKLAGFGSDLAKAKAVAIMAEIDKEQAGNNERIRGNIQNQNNAIMGQEISRRGDEMRAAQAARSQRFAENQVKAQNEANAKAMAQAKKDAINGNVIIDTTPGAVGKDGRPKMWAFLDPKLPADKKYELKTRATSVAVLSESLEEFRELARSNGPNYEGKFKDLTRTQKQARQDQLSTRIVQQLALEATGKAMTDSERQDFKSLIKPDSWTNKRKVEQLASQLEQSYISRENHDLGQFTRPLTEEERGLVDTPTPVPSDNIGPNADIQPESFGVKPAINAKISVEPDPLEKSETQRLQDNLNSSKSKGTIDNPSDSENEAYKNYLTENGEELKNHTGEKKYDWSKLEVPRSFAIMVDLYGKAQGGNVDALNSLKQTSQDTENTFFKDTSYPSLVGYPTLTDKAKQASYFLSKLTGVDELEKNSNVADDYANGN